MFIVNYQSNKKTTHLKKLYVMLMMVNFLNHKNTKILFLLIKIIIKKLLHYNLIKIYKIGK